MIDFTNFLYWEKTVSYKQLYIYVTKYTSTKFYVFSYQVTNVVLQRNIIGAGWFEKGSLDLSGND